MPVFLTEEGLIHVSATTQENLHSGGLTVLIFKCPTHFQSVNPKAWLVQPSQKKHLQSDNPRRIFLMEAQQDVQNRMQGYFPSTFLQQADH